MLKLEVGKSYRTVDGRNTGPLHKIGKYFSGDVIKARDFSGQIMADGKQFWHETGNVVNPRCGEENDRIVAEWSEVIAGKTYYGSRKEVKVEAVANDWVFYSFGDGANTLRTEAFLARYQPERPTKTVWVNLWRKNGTYVDTGATHETEEAARATGNGPEAVYIKTISLEVPT